MVEPTSPESKPTDLDSLIEGGHRRPDVNLDDLKAVTNSTGTQDRSGFDGGSAEPASPLVPPQTPKSPGKGK